MKVGIIGGGKVGSSFGKALIKAGHEIQFSSRDPQGSHAQQLQAETGAPVGTIADTLAFSSVIAIAMPPAAIPELVAEYKDLWKDKVIIDMNNQLAPSPADAFGSFASYLASLTQGKVIKAFNTIGAEHYQNPVIDGQHASMLIAGDDAEAKQVVSQLASDIGFDVIDAGGLSASKIVENLAGVWIYLAFSAGHGRNIAFKLLKG